MMQCSSVSQIFSKLSKTPAFFACGQSQRCHACAHVCVCVYIVCVCVHVCARARAHARAQTSSNFLYESLSHALSRSLTPLLFRFLHPLLVQLRYTNNSPVKQRRINSLLPPILSLTNTLQHAAIHCNKLLLRYTNSPVKQRRIKSFCTAAAAAVHPLAD